MRSMSQLVPGTGDGLTLTGTPWSDQLRGEGGLDTISGLEGHDFLEGWGGNDVLEGGSGDDGLVGGEGNDQLAGGEGSDVAIFSGYFSDYNISYDSATRSYTLQDQLVWRDGTDTVQGVENFAFADGMRSMSQLVLGAGDGLTLTGTPWSDQLRGEGGLDTISGLEGHDFLEGWGGNDVLESVSGDDGLVGGEGNDQLAGGEVSDVAILSGYFVDYNIIYDGATRRYTLQDQLVWRDGTTTVQRVDNLAFADGMRSMSQLVPGAGDG